MTRPASCRNAQRDADQPYPKSGCSYCLNGGLMGCPFEKPRRFQKETGGDWFGVNGAGVEYRFLDVAPTLERGALKDPEFVRRLNNASNALQNDLAEMCKLLGLPGAPQSRPPHEVFQDCLAAIRARTQGTPAAQWRVDGKPDPTPTDQERADLPLGRLTDDQIANAAYFELCNVREDVSNAAKVRMRWLSRRLVEAEAKVAELDKLIADSVIGE